MTLHDEARRRQDWNHMRTELRNLHIARNSLCPLPTVLLYQLIRTTKMLRWALRGESPILQVAGTWIKPRFFTSAPASWVLAFEAVGSQTGFWLHFFSYSLCSCSFPSYFLLPSPNCRNTFYSPRYRCPWLCQWEVGVSSSVFLSPRIYQTIVLKTMALQNTLLWKNTSNSEIVAYYSLLCEKHEWKEVYRRLYEIVQQSYRT